MKILPCLLALLLLGAAQAETPDLRKFQGREDVWPREVTIKTALPAGPGAAALPAGTKGKVVGVEGSLIGVEVAGGLRMVPAEQTDFAEKAAAALAANPTPPPRPGAANRVAPAAPNAPAAAAPKPGPAGKGHPLGVLEQYLMTADGTRIPPGQVNLARRNFILLQFGGGPKWEGPLKELVAAVQAARKRGANFEVVQVPAPGMTVEMAGRLMRDGGGYWPCIDPRAQALVEGLWKEVGHPGTFALSLINANAEVVVRTVPKDNNSIDLFHSVTEALGKIP